MFIEIGIIAAGVPIGFALRKHEKVKMVTEKLSTWVVYALLFVLGIKIGTNDEVMASLGILGFKALFFCICISFGSILFGLWAFKKIKGLQ